MKTYKLLTADEVSKSLGVSVSYAYKIIRQLNDELQEQEYLTIHGKIDSSYFQKRFFPSFGKEDIYASV